MLKLLALVLLLAVPALALESATTWAQTGVVWATDAGDTVDPNLLDVQRALVLTPDAGVVPVTGGCWTSTQQCIATGKELASLRSKEKSYEETPLTTELTWFGAGFGTAVVVTVVTVLVVGAVAAQKKPQ